MTTCQFPNLEHPNQTCNEKATDSITLDACPKAMWPDAKYRIYVTVPLCAKHRVFIQDTRDGK